jgi:hypothetical protein
MPRPCHKSITKRKFDAVNYELRTNGTGNAATLPQINNKLQITNYKLTGRAMQRPCPVRDRILVENSISHKQPSRQGRNVFVFPIMYSLFVDKSYPLFTIRYPLSTIHYPLSTIHYPLSTIHYPLSTIHYPLSTINYQLYTIHNINH